MICNECNRTCVSVTLRPNPFYADVWQELVMDLLCDDCTAELSASI